MGDGGFVVADIPGIIEGAHEGTGLGHEFLRHVERTKLLLHIVDVSGIEGRNPVEDFDAINNELRLYSEKLAQKPQIVLANKADLPSFEDNFAEFKEEIEKRGHKVFAISAATKKGITEVLKYTMEQLSLMPAEDDADEYEMYDTEQIRGEDELKIIKTDDAYEVEGLKARKLVGSTNFDDYESLQYFQRALIKTGIIRMLEEAGINEGDTVRIYGAEFDFVK